MAVNFLLSGWTGHQNINVAGLSEEAIQEIYKAASITSKYFILQALLCDHQRTGTFETTRQAAQLFLQLHVTNQRDFLVHLLSDRKLFNNFCDAMRANTIMDEAIEELESGASGLTKKEFSLERAYFKIFNQYRVG